MARKDDFLSSYLKKRKNPEKLSRFAVDSDKYDQESVQSLIKQIEDFNASRERLVESKAGDLGYDVWQDLFLEFWKVAPEILPPGKVRPSHLVNRVVVEEAAELNDFKELRQWTQGDDIGSALACNTIEPDIETLYDRLEEEIKQSQKLDEIMQELFSSEQQQRDMDEMHDQWMQQQPEEREPIDWNERKSQMQEKIDQLSEQAQEAAQELEQALNDAKPDIRQTVRTAMKKANEDTQAQQAIAESFGLEPGALHRLPAEQRIELARKMNNPKFKRIAQLFGPMKRLAFSEQRRKVNYAPEEIYDVELGNNISKLLPEELTKIKDPRRKRLFFKDFTEKHLLQYKMRGHEKVGKGGIIYCHDGSGSMGGDPEIWAKAVGLSLLHIAKKQKRSFWGIQFGSPGQIRVDDFTDTQSIQPESVIDFAEFFFGGGTDFETPLNRAIDIMNSEHQRTGAIKSDIVFATDGMCSVSDEWLKQFKAEQKRLGFTVWGINIGGNSGDEPLRTICDGRVATIQSLHSGENIRDIFGGI